MTGSRVVDLGGFVLWTVITVVVVSAGPSVVWSLGLRGIKIGLLIAGIIALTGALLLLKPTRPGEDSSTQDEATRIDGFVGRLPPQRWYPIHPEDHVPLGSKTAVAGITMLVLSYTMEAIFHV